MERDATLTPTTTRFFANELE